MKLLLPAIVSITTIITVSGGESEKYRNGRITEEYDAKLRSEYVAEQCNTGSMVGDKVGVQTIFYAKYKELESARALITLERYRTLSQRLEGYKVEWELTHKELERSCMAYASCRYSFYDSAKQCEPTRTDYSDTRDKMLTFVRNLNSLGVD